MTVWPVSYRLKKQYYYCFKPIHPLIGKKKSEEHIKNMKKSFKSRPKRTPEQNAHHSLKMKEYHAKKKEIL